MSKIYIFRRNNMKLCSVSQLWNILQSYSSIVIPLHAEDITSCLHQSSTQLISDTEGRSGIKLLYIL